MFLISANKRFHSFMSLDICSVCSEIVKNIQQAISCDCCFHWEHARCMFISRTEYGISGTINEAWFCSYCLSNSLFLIV